MLPKQPSPACLLWGDCPPVTSSSARHLTRRSDPEARPGVPARDCRGARSRSFRGTERRTSAHLTSPNSPACLARAEPEEPHYLHDYLAGQLRGAEELQDPPVGRHFLGALRVAVGEEVAVIALLRLAQCQTLHLTPTWPGPGIDPAAAGWGGRQRERKRGRPRAAAAAAAAAARGGRGWWTELPRAASAVAG